MPSSSCFHQWSRKQQIRFDIVDSSINENVSRNDDGTAFVDFTSHFNRIVIGRHWSSLVVIVQVTQSKSLFNSIHSFIQSSILLEIIVRDGTVFVDSISLQWKRHCCHLFRSDNGSLYSFIHSSNRNINIDILQSKMKALVVFTSPQ